MNAKKTRPGREFTEGLEHLTLVTQLGLTMAGSIGLGFFAGFYLDRWLGTRGLFLIVFILLGVAGGFITVFREITKTLAQGEDENQDTPQKD